ncbi:MAG: hypothetical protein FWD61_05540 [Phycisphaerales bacterium]|nr:hypothetical protein [Phycisphaerales bacterium]
MCSEDGRLNTGDFAGLPLSQTARASAKSTVMGCRSSLRRLEYAATTLTAGPPSASRSKRSGVKLASSLTRSPVPTAAL